MISHGFEDGEIIRYSNDGVRIGGLDTDQDYYVLKLMIINLDSQLLESELLSQIQIIKK